MITKAFAVYDSKASCFGVPFFMATTGLAVRAFSELVNDPKSTVSRYPTDFVLFQVGEFDDQKGIFVPMEHQVNLGMASEYVRENRTPMLPGFVEQLKEEENKK